HDNAPTSKRRMMIKIRIRKGRRKGPSTCWYQGNLDGPLRRIEESAPGKEKPPRITLGERKAVFWVCQVKTVAPTVGGIPILDAWPCGLRRRIDPSPAEGRLEADLDALRNESHDHRVSRFGSLLAGTQKSAHRRLEHLFIRP